ncbi:hypothetical protein ABZP36_017369, partial [Zizania latifolia]
MKDSRKDFSLPDVLATGSAGAVRRIGHPSSVVLRPEGTTEDLAGRGGGMKVGDMEKWREIADSPGELCRRRDDILQLLFAVSWVPSLAGTTGNAAAAAAAGNQLQLSHHGCAQPKSQKKNRKEASCTSAAAAAEPGDHNADDEVEVEPEEGEFVPDLAASDGGGHFHDNDGNNTAAAEDDETPSLIDQHMVEIAKMLADEIGEESEQINESADTLFDCLRRLQLMRLSVEKLKVYTHNEILNAVAPLKNHKSPNICELVSTVTDGWKGAASDWVRATSTTIVGNRSAEDFLHTSTILEDEVGLLTPPMDVGAFMLTHSTAIEHVSEILNAGPDAHVTKKQEQTETLQPLTKDDKNKLHNGQDLPTKQQLPIVGERKPVPGRENVSLYLMHATLNFL